MILTFVVFEIINIGVQLSTEHQRTLSATFAKYKNQMSTLKRKRQETQSELAMLQSKKQETEKAYDSAQHEYQQATGSDKSDVTNNILELIKMDMMKKKAISNIGDCSDLGGNSAKGSITVVLRPTWSRMFHHFRQFVQQYSDQKVDGTNDFDPVRAEELLLLALHPASDDKRLPLQPIDHDESKPWAEPGYQLILEVPNDEQRSHTILPTRYEDIFFRQMHSECSSAKGRQASAFINRQHYQYLTTGILQG